MKLKILSLAAALACLILPLSAADFAPPSPDSPDFSLSVARYLQLDIMAKQGAYKKAEGISLMREYSLDLDPYYRIVLYKQYRKEPIGAALLNVVTGGLGSWAMGDRIVGGTLTIAGLALTGVSTLMMIPTNGIITDRKGALNISLISGGVLLAVGAGWPFVYSLFQNRKLRSALSYD